MDKPNFQRYAESFFANCPFCDSDNITGDGSFDIETKSQKVCCLECGKKWNDLFDIIGVEEIED